MKIEQIPTNAVLTQKQFEKHLSDVTFDMQSKGYPAEAINQYKEAAVLNRHLNKKTIDIRLSAQEFAKNDAGMTTAEDLLKHFKGNISHTAIALYVTPVTLRSWRDKGILSDVIYHNGHGFKKLAIQEN